VGGREIGIKEIDRKKNNGEIEKKREVGGQRRIPTHQIPREGGLAKALLKGDARVKTSGNRKRPGSPGGRPWAQKGRGQAKVSKKKSRESDRTAGFSAHIEKK